MEKSIKTTFDFGVKQTTMYLSTEDVDSLCVQLTRGKQGFVVMQNLITGIDYLINIAQIKFVSFEDDEDDDVDLKYSQYINEGD